MPATTRFVPNFIGIRAVANRPFMVAGMLELANQIADAAKSIAPVGPGKGGHYKDQIAAEGGFIEGYAAARVNAHKFTSGFIEFGTSDTPAFAVLRTACDSVGATIGAPR